VAVAPRTEPPAPAPPAAVAAPLPAPAAPRAATAPRRAAPRVSGRARVGQTLRCSATTKVSWLRDGRPIRGARRPRYRLTRADAGRRITCAAAGLRSRPTARVARR
jgi:hypothetical protein